MTASGSEYQPGNIGLPDVRDESTQEFMKRIIVSNDDNAVKNLICPLNACIYF
jgi:hypothetical protein